MDALRKTLAGEWGERGQSTVEYALIVFAFMASIVGLGAIWHGARDGVLLRLCTESLSHELSARGDVGSVQDVSLY